jgi:hypothetical protein
VCRRKEQRNVKSSSFNSTNPFLLSRKESHRIHVCAGQLREHRGICGSRVYCELYPTDHTAHACRQVPLTVYVCVYVCVVIFCVTSLRSILYDVCYMTFLCLSLNVCGVWCVASSSTPFTEHGTWTKIPPSILPPICVLSERTLNKQQFALVVSLTRILLRKVIKMRTDELGKRRESNVCNCLTRSYIMLHNSVLYQRSIHLFSNRPLH